MKMSRAVVLLLCVAAINASCRPDAGTDPGSDTTTNVTGTWNATIVVSENGQQMSDKLVYVMNQSGSAVTGTADADPHQSNTTPGSLTGTVSGKTLTVHAFGSASPKDDCGQYAHDFVADVNGSTMTVKSGSGFDCEGDQQGGHIKLVPVTIVSGTLTKQ